MATSASKTKPLSSVPPGSRCQSQTTWLSGKGICCRASYRTMSGILRGSIGGSLTNFDSPDVPGMLTTTRSPVRSFREVNSVSASRTSSVASASGCERIIGYWM